MSNSESTESVSIRNHFISLTSKPSAKISYYFIPASGSNSHQPLVVFLNGLGLPSSSWLPTISSITSRESHPALLSYDRYGQGLSNDRDPLDTHADDPVHGHDCIDVVQDLKQLISQICALKGLNIAANSANSSDMVEPNIFFVANSIGCAIARLFAQEYPHTVSALLFLDSVIANSDFVSMWP